MTQSESRPTSSWITLGTCGGPFQSTASHQISNALAIGDDVYLFDVGNGVLRQLVHSGFDVARIRAVFITHHHPDHIADLGLVILTRTAAGATEPLHIRGPEGTVHLATGLARAHHYTLVAGRNDDADALAHSIAVEEVPRTAAPQARTIYTDELISVSAVDVEHFTTREHEPRPEEPHAIGFRIACGDRTIAYTGDTGPCPALSVLAEQADLLVTEVVDLEAILGELRASPNLPETARERITFNMSTNHFPATDIGELAAAADVDRVLLTHYVPVPDASARETLLEDIARAFPRSRVVFAEDLGRY